jgi:hypothetical protein
VSQPRAYERFTGVNASSLAIAAVVLAAAIAAFPGRATADDYGPHPILRDLRGSAPILIAHFVPALVVGDAVIEGDEAIVMWESAGKNGLATFHRRNDRWWIDRVYDLSATSVKRQPEEWAKTLTVSPAMAARAEQHISGFDTQAPIARPQPLYTPCGACVFKFRSANDGFETALQVEAAIPTLNPNLAVVSRAPTVGEMPPTPHMNAFYFFSITTQGTQPVVLEGAAFDVWFPYVLDAKQKYALLLGFVNPNIEDIPGTLSDNTLHFTLPAFATIPGKDALGEIDGDFP